MNLRTIFLLMTGTLLLSCSSTTMDGQDSVTESTLESITDLSALNPAPGKTYVLESGRKYEGSILIEDLDASQHPLTITTSGKAPAIIDASGEIAGIIIRNSSGIIVRNLIIEANGSKGKTPWKDPAKPYKMRCGLLVQNTRPGHYSGFIIEKTIFRNIYFENEGFVRDPADTHTPNGTQSYGYGIRILNQKEGCTLEGLDIRDCEITDLSHTGIKISGKNHSITGIDISGCKVHHTGGPGIQMSCVKDVRIHHNTIDHSGSTTDSRNWARGSGFWCWSSSNIVLEHNSLTYAHGPADSAGAHIDFNCSDIVYQYNYSAWNDGGFVEILGNNRNCSYRYNISVEDGQRHKQNTGNRLVWCSGYVGKGNPPAGPYYSYIYNNTVYVSEALCPEFYFAASMQNTLVANNIFHFKGKSGATLGSANASRTAADLGLVFRNNLCLNASNLPDKLEAQGTLIGDPSFAAAGENRPEAYVPSVPSLIGRGCKITPLPGDPTGLAIGLEVRKDFFGRKISSPILGAVTAEPLAH